MSVTGKTLGTVLVGLVGLLVYLAVYLGGVYGIAAITTTAIYAGLALTATMLVVVMLLTLGRVGD